MGKLGRLLAKRREERGLSFGRIKEATGISEEYVRALEREEFQAFHSQAEAMSYLRAYARYLGLDPREVGSLLGVKEVKAAPPQPSREESPPLSPLFRPLVAALTALLLIGLLALAYLVLFRG